MLKEELEKEIREYIKNIPFVYETDLVKKIVRMYCEDAIKYGIELGKAHIWHDLRKNPDDLPPMIEDERMISESVWIHIENWGSEIGHFDYRKNAWIVRCRVVNLNVLAWVDIPKYTEEAKLEKGLEQENSELKEKLAIERSAKGDWLEKAATKDRLLTKAKKIISKYYNYNPSCNYLYEDIDKEAEQFLEGE